MRSKQNDTHAFSTGDIEACDNSVSSLDLGHLGTYTLDDAHDCEASVPVSSLAT